MSLGLTTEDALDACLLSGVTNDAGSGIEAQPAAASHTHARQSVAVRIIGGTSALGLGVLIERGAGFAANILAARLGGAATFGAYSLAISTANQISTYAAGGIGATAARFSGKYPHGAPEYPLLARVLITVSLVSAAIAAVALWWGAGPIAHLLGKRDLTLLLRTAALSAAGIIVLECARGFFVGQRRLAALVLLSLLVGGSLLCLLPLAASHHAPVRMVIIQGTITSAAVVACLLLARPLGLTMPHRPARVTSVTFAGMLREVSSFGLVQLAGLIASNLSGWWLTTLVARDDTTLVQMSFFAIASQLRNLAGIAPGLLTEGSYAVMADPLGEEARTPQRVMEMCTFTSVAVSMALATLGIILVPWGITLLYGRAYASAGLAAAVGLGLAVVHMGNAPASARLSIVSLRSAGVINTVWAVVVGCSATLFLFFGGGAAEAMAIYLVAHALSAGLTLAVLRRKDRMRLRMFALFALTTSTITLLLALAALRAADVHRSSSLTALMLAVSLLSMAAMFALGKRYQLLPSADRLRALRSRLGTYITRRQTHV